MNMAAVSWLNNRIILKLSYTGLDLKYGVCDCGIGDLCSEKSDNGIKSSF